ncbi:MAG: hypothetical protein K0Q54_4652, partial [Methylobacterium brachiatum]|nr:hypothetical protein [Methylobacterium brachiatum]
HAGVPVFGLRRCEACPEALADLV